ncbi:Ubiquinone biosynthesis protein COQ7 [Thelohanellus kitauei]|uniref:Ubiquinone biosynthesis protein COQ7 n=1 Tax=Thelohanellus kitauei TaxID=669202 RepID=A0A0C2JDX7_THEKT|nr:Ubiquinone biosynthesis protein COQ7 [Thelohanellus kitauei]
MSGHQSPDPLLDQMIRVDHSGEAAAVEIYRGQMFWLAATEHGDQIHSMFKNELDHIKVMEKLIDKHNVRPSYLLPLWRFLGLSLGLGSGVFGHQASMGVTVMVENVIMDHYHE